MTLEVLILMPVMAIVDDHRQAEKLAAEMTETARRNMIAVADRNHIELAAMERHIRTLDAIVIELK